MSDPSTESWRRSLELSTGALLHRALDANQELAMEHAKCVTEIHRLRAENEQLRTQITHRPGPYWLTAKGLAATEPEAVTRPKDGPMWCWTDDRQPNPFCYKEGHDVRGYRGMSTPEEPGEDQ